jgi:hypothetical protein
MPSRPRKKVAPTDIVVSQAASAKVASPEEYNAFIDGVELRSLRLAHCEVDAISRYDGQPLIPEVEEGETSFKSSGDNFTILHELRFCGRPASGEGQPVQIRATFELQYSSDIPMVDSLFEIFRSYNLPVNVWPFFREFVHTVLARANWPVFVLPALKITPIGRPRRRRVSPQPEPETAQ